MPKFRVVRLKDAWIRYVKEFEADTAEDAAELAKEDDHGAGDDPGDWTEDGVMEFDDTRYNVEDESGYVVYDDGDNR